MFLVDENLIIENDKLDLFPINTKPFSIQKL